MGGHKIVLAASRTESNEYQQDCWIQMLFATLPVRIARRLMDVEILKNELRNDGQAGYVPNGLLGAPGETKETVEESLAFADSCILMG